MDDVLYEELEPGVVLLTLNRPQRRNALSSRLLGALHAAFDRLAGDPDARVVIITGAGTGFCSGADMRSGPEEAIGRVLGAPVLFLGVGLPDDRIHAPNERMVMDQFWRGLVAAAELWHELGAMGREGLARAEAGRGAA